MSLDATTRRRSLDGRSAGARAARDLLADHAGTLLMVGGLLWICTYIVEVLIGVLLGEAVYAAPEASSSWLVWLWPATFMAAIFSLATGLLGIAARVPRRGRVLGLLGGLLAGTALIASSVNIVRLTGMAGRATASDDLGFVGVLGVMGASVLLGAAALRGAILPRWVRLTLALIPLAFVPAIVATIPLEGVAPDYVVADLPFPVVGLVLATVGLALRRDRQVGTAPSP